MTNLEHFLESIVYIISIVSKLRKSKVQHFKRCANRSLNEEVMTIWRQLHQAENEFRNPFSALQNFRKPIYPFAKLKNFATPFEPYKIFASPSTPYEIEEFHKPFYALRNLPV